MPASKDLAGFNAAPLPVWPKQTPHDGRLRLYTMNFYTNQSRNMTKWERAKTLKPGEAEHDEVISSQAPKFRLDTVQTLMQGKNDHVRPDGVR